MPKKSGKDKGSITQKADSQDVRISQVSNVSSAVSAMGKKTTAEIKETERRIAAGGDSREIAGSMNSVLKSLKSTVDGLGRGVEAITIGTAKATKDAISQYGQAISEDFKVNRQNMVASALAQSTPIFGYFASKFMETGVFKQTKEKLSEGISGIFKRKSKGGVLPDDFGGGDNGGVPKAFKPIVEPIKQNQQIIAKELPKLRQGMVKDKATMFTKFKQVSDIKQKEFDEPAEDRMLKSLAAIQGALGAQVGKWSQIYNKMLIEHPVFRGMVMTGRVMKNTFGLAWKAAYFIFKPRGGYRRFLSKSKQPLDAINQNIGQLFMQQIPRLDAIMIYTKATAIAMRDLSSHVTQIKYPRMDPSRLGANWSIGGVTMKGVRAIGRGLMKGAKFGVSKIFKGRKQDIANQILEQFGVMGRGIDIGLTGPGQLKAYLKSKTGGAKERKRLFGGLAETGGRKKREREPRKPKGIRGMGIRHTPAIYVQGVYDEYYINKEKASKKRRQKLLGWTSAIAKGMKEHNKREKRRSVWKFLGMIGSGIMKGLGAIVSFATSLLSNPYVIFGTILAGAGTMIVKWFHKNITPQIQSWVDRQMIKASEIGKKAEVTGADIGARRKGDVAATGKLAMQTGITLATEAADLPMMMQNYYKSFIGGRYEYMAEHLPQYGDFTIQEIAMFRKEHMKKLGTRFSMKNLGWDVKKMNAEGAREMGYLIEEKFLKWLISDKKKDILEDPTEKAAWGARRAKLAEAKKKYGKDKSTRELDVLQRATAHAKASAKQEEEKAKGISGRLTMEKALEWAEKYGGSKWEYFNLKITDARDVAKGYGASFVEKAKAAATISYEKAQELGARYKAPAKEFMGKTLDQALAYGKIAITKAEAGAKTIKEKAIEIAEDTGLKEKKGWFAKQWEAMKKWGKSPTVTEAAGFSGRDVIKKSGEYIEVGKGNFVEIYRQGAAGAKELYETATSPGMKDYIRRNAEQLLATGQITVDQLKKLGIDVGEKAKEIGEGIQSTMVQTTAYTTNSINETMNNYGGGGGGGNANRMMDEVLVDRVSVGDIL